MYAVLERNDASEVSSDLAGRFDELVLGFLLVRNVLCRLYLLAGLQALCVQFVRAFDLLFVGILEKSVKIRSMDDYFVSFHIHVMTPWRSVKSALKNDNAHREFAQYGILC